MQWLQTALWERHKIQTVRRTLAQLHQEANISSSGQLSIQDEVVALVYFRAGYAPTDYPTNVEWDIRLACCQCIMIMLDMCKSCLNNRVEACTGHVRCMQGLHEGSQGMHSQGVRRQLSICFFVMLVSYFGRNTKKLKSRKQHVGPQ